MFRTALILALPVIMSGQTRSEQTRPRPSRPNPTQNDQARPRNGEFRQRMMARLYAVRTNRLKEALGVPEEKAKAIADRWRQFDMDSMDRRQNMRQLHQQVNDVLTGPGTEEEKNNKLRPLMDQFTSLRQVQQEAKSKFEDDIRATLTPAQQGRFLLLVDEFQRNLQEAIQEQRKSREQP